MNVWVTMSLCWVRSIVWFYCVTPRSRQCWWVAESALKFVRTSYNRFTDFCLFAYVHAFMGKKPDGFFLCKTVGSTCTELVNYYYRWGKKSRKQEESRAMTSCLIRQFTAEVVTRRLKFSVTNWSGLLVGARSDLWVNLSRGRLLGEQEKQ